MDKKIKIWFELYNCNYKKNKCCRKSICKYFDCGACKMTHKWKYAKRTPINYIKRVINIIRGVN